MSAQQILDQLSQAIVDGEMEHTGLLAEEAVKAQVPAEEIVRVASMAMKRTGQLYESKEYFVADLIASAEAMKPVLQVVEPLIAANKGAAIGRVVIGTVQGDLHDIGKNLVAMMLKGAGFEVIDLGVDSSPEKFVAKAKESNPQIIGLSALLTTTMPAMEKTIRAIKDAGLSAKTMIGGAPVTQAYADKIGADGYAPDAASAVDLAKSLLN